MIGASLSNLSERVPLYMSDSHQRQGEDLKGEKKDSDFEEHFSEHAKLVYINLFSTLLHG